MLLGIPIDTVTALKAFSDRFVKLLHGKLGRAQATQCVMQVLKSFAALRTLACSQSVPDTRPSINMQLL